MSEPVYAIGDVHGQLSELDRVLALIEKDGGAASKVVFLGDYVDRGPDSAGVLDRITSGQQNGRNWVTLMGNHDRMFRLFLQSPPQADPHLMIQHTWLHPRLGGDSTLASYGLSVEPTTRLKDLHAAALLNVPKLHMDFLNGLDLTHLHGDLLFVHAGIRPGVPLSAQSEEDLIWIRDEFHSFSEPHPYLVVHGHTPEKRVTHYGNRVNLDTGAGYGNPLSVVVFEGKDTWCLTKNGRVPLKPTTR